MGTGAASPSSRSAPLTGSTTGGVGSGAAASAATLGVVVCEETAFNVPRSSVDFSVLVALKARK